MEFGLQILFFQKKLTKANVLIDFSVKKLCLLFFYRYQSLIIFLGNLLCVMLSKSCSRCKCYCLYFSAMQWNKQRRVVDHRIFRLFFINGEVNSQLVSNTTTKKIMQLELVGWLFQQHLQPKQFFPAVDLYSVPQNLFYPCNAWPFKQLYI